MNFWYRYQPRAKGQPPEFHIYKKDPAVVGANYLGSVRHKDQAKTIVGFLNKCYPEQSPGVNPLP